MFRPWITLTKPGIIRGNVLTALGGALLASGRSYDLNIILGLVVGSSLIIAASCVANNILDKNIDARMERTKTRAISSGSISVSAAWLYAAILIVIGAATLYLTTNVLTLGLGLFGSFAYIALYGAAKRAGDYGTLVGTISGAVPIVAGYTAVSGRLDLTALLLGLVMVAWQMPHFYAIAIYRKKDYANADIPVLSVTKGNQASRKQIIGYMIVFVLSLIGLTLSGATGIIFLIVMLLVSSWWLRTALHFKNGRYEPWAKKVFLQSLIIVSIFSILLMCEPYLP